MKRFIYPALLAAVGVLAMGSISAFGETRIIYGPGITIRGVTAPVGPGDGSDGDSGIDSTMSVGEYFKTETVEYVGTVVSVDTEDTTILLNVARVEGDAAGLYDDMIFNYIPEVPIVDAAGEPVDVSSLEAGDEVRAWSGRMMTMSIPPIVNLQKLIVL